MLNHDFKEMENHIYMAELFNIALAVYELKKAEEENPMCKYDRDIDSILSLSTDEDIDNFLDELKTKSNRKYNKFMESIEEIVEDNKEEFESWDPNSDFDVRDLNAYNDLETLNCTED